MTPARPAPAEATNPPTHSEELDVTTPPTHRPARARAGDDAGFTLLEVIVSLVLIGVIATAAITMVTRGVANSASLERQRTAVTLADAAMEQVRSLGAQSSGGATALVAGRTATAVSQQWSASKNPDRAATFPASDASATTTSTPVVPLTNPAPTVVNGVPFTTSTLIGTCYRKVVAPTAGAAPSTPCDTAGGDGKTARSGYRAMTRVVVEVSWPDASAKGCSAGTCTFSVSGLADSNTELTWSQPDPVVAVDDSATVTSGASVVIDVLSNDTGAPAARNPVRVLTPPSSGTTSTDPLTGKITYTSVRGETGTRTLTYQFSSSTGRVSNTATVTITVRPAGPTASDCSILVPASSQSAVDLQLAQCVTGASGAVTFTIRSISVTQGQLLVDGREANNNRTGRVVSYQPQNNVTGRHTFTWTATDANGTSATATATIRIVPVAVDDSASVRRGTQGAQLNVFGNDRPSNYGQTVEVFDFETPSCGRISSQQPNLQNGIVSYDAPTTTGTCTARYRLQGKANGTLYPEDLSGWATITIRVTN